MQSFMASSHVAVASTQTLSVLHKDPHLGFVIHKNREVLTSSQRKQFDRISFNIINSAPQQREIILKTNPFRYYSRNKSSSRLSFEEQEASLRTLYFDSNSGKQANVLDLSLFLIP